MIRDDFDFVVVIDIGVSYTACCYTVVDNDKPDIITIKNWPRQAVTESTFPTVIAYSSLNPYQTVVGFGNVPDAPTTLQINDLPYLLTNDHPLNSLESGNLDTATSIKIVADYLKVINAHILKRLLLKHKNADKVRYCFTKYSHREIYEENLMQAIELAGISSEDNRNIIFVDTYLAIAKHISNSRTDLQLSDNFIICDADSTYLNIKTMELVSKGREVDVVDRKVQSYELNVNDIDNRFDDFIFNVLQKHPDYQGAQMGELLTIKKAAVDYFVKNVKYSVDFNSKKEIFLRVPSLLTASKSPNYIQLNLDELKSKVYDDIINHICNQMYNVIERRNIPPSFIFLCGKMSKSIYLRQRLQAMFKVLAILPEEQLPAAQGAIHYGLTEELKIKRVAPMPLGKKLRKILEDESYYDFTYDIYTHIIGIDFGTSFSKWYYLPTKGSTETEIDADCMICPTLSLYDERLQKQKYWGESAFNDYYGTGKSGQLLNRFKLYLDEVENHDFDEAIAVKVIANYLEALHSYICQHMPGDKKSFRYCLTVPTIWGDKTKKSMRKAALQANIITEFDHPCRLMLVNEAEAAAMYYTRESFIANISADKQLRALVCDAGGGTVDMATYEYFRKNPNDTACSINEVTKSSGGLCGSSFVEDNFRNLVKRKCYEKNFIISKYDLEASIKYFTFHIKHEFSDNSQDFIPIEINKTEKNTFKKETITFSKSDIKEKVFDPVVKKIIELIEVQVDQTLSSKKHLDYIILSGGLGQSVYLRDRILKMDVVVKNHIEVFQPTGYNFAIVKGAVQIAKNPNAITQRIVRKTFGIEVIQPYDPGTDTVINQHTMGGEVFSKFKFDKLIDMGTSVQTYEYYEKEYEIKYPNNTFAALYSTGVDVSSNSTLHPDIKEVFRYLIDTPKMENKKKGDKIKITIRVYFGQTEIKVDTIFDNLKPVRQSFQYYAENDSKLQELEDKHHQRVSVTPLSPVPVKSISTARSERSPVRRESFFKFSLGAFGKKKSK